MLTGSAFAARVLGRLGSGEWVVAPGVIFESGWSLQGYPGRQSQLPVAAEFGSIRVSTQTWVIPGDPTECIQGTCVGEVYISSGNVSRTSGFSQAILNAAAHPELGVQVLEWLSPTIEDYLLSTRTDYGSGVWLFRLTTAQDYYAWLETEVPKAPPVRPKLSSFFGARVFQSPTLATTLSLVPPTTDSPCTTHPSSTLSTPQPSPSAAASSSILSEILSPTWGS